MEPEIQQLKEELRKKQIQLNEKQLNELYKNGMTSLMENFEYNGQVNDSKIKAQKENNEWKFELHNKSPKLTIPKKIMGSSLSNEQTKMLEQGKSIELTKFGKTVGFVQVDNELNKVVVRGNNEVGIPEKMGDYKLNSEDKQKLMSGEQMDAKVFYDDKTNTYITANLAMSEKGDGFEFHNVKPVTQAQAEELRETLNNKSAVNTAYSLAVDHINIEEAPDKKVETKTEVETNRREESYEVMKASQKHASAEANKENELNESPKSAKEESYEVMKASQKHASKEAENQMETSVTSDGEVSMVTTTQGANTSAETSTTLQATTNLSSEKNLEVVDSPTNQSKPLTDNQGDLEGQSDKRDDKIKTNQGNQSIDAIIDKVAETNASKDASKQEIKEALKDGVNSNYKKMQELQKKSPKTMDSVMSDFVKHREVKAVDNLRSMFFASGKNRKQTESIIKMIRSASEKGAKQSVGVSTASNIASKELKTPKQDKAQEKPKTASKSMGMG